MRNILRSVRVVALLLPLASWIAPKESRSEDSSAGRTDASVSIIHEDAGFINNLQKPDHPTQAQATEAYGKLPLSFEANQGQMDSDVKFFSRGTGYGIFLTPTETVLSLSSGSRAEERRRKQEGKKADLKSPQAASP